MIVVRRCQSRIMESIFSVASRRTNRARTRSPRFHQLARNHHPSNVVIIAIEKMGFWRRSREAEPEVRIHSPQQGVYKPLVPASTPSHVERPVRVLVVREGSMVRIRLPPAPLTMLCAASD